MASHIDNLQPTNLIYTTSNYQQQQPEPLYYFTNHRPQATG